MDTLLLFPILFFMLILFVGIFGYIRERRIWNGGICKISNKPWKFFDTDSQGGRGYSDGEGNDCWLSYRLD
jgi:hypothetical protein